MIGTLLWWDKSRYHGFWIINFICLFCGIKFANYYHLIFSLFSAFLKEYCNIYTRTRRGEIKFDWDTLRWNVRKSCSWALLSFRFFAHWRAGNNDNNNNNNYDSMFIGETEDCWKKSPHTIAGMFKSPK